MSAPAKYARVRSRQNGSWKNGGKKLEQYYQSIRGETRPVVGGSLVALEARLAAIESALTNTAPHRMLP